MNAHSSADYEIPEFLIDGRFFTPSRPQDSNIVNPATGEVLAMYTKISDVEVASAVSAASRAFGAWGRTSPFERSRILTRAASLIRDRQERIARILTLENGKPLAEARTEVAFSANLFEWLGEEACHAYGRIVPGRIPGTRFTVEPEPLGPVAALTPWNFPAVTPARKVAAALAAGCTVVVKPAEETPGSMIALARCLEEAGLPPGVLNVVFGDPAAISSQLIAAPEIRKVSFTGSVRVGKLLTRQAADHMKRVTMELGGHAPVVVFDDVNPQEAAAACAAGKLRNGGQVCTSPTRFYVQDGVHDAFLDALVKQVSATRVGSGLDERNQMGPMANSRRMDAIQGLIRDAVERGAKLHCGGERVGNAGNFLSPAVLSDVPSEARVMREEPFGPIALVRRWNDYDAMLAEANGTNLGLAAYIFTGSTDRAERAARDIESGVVGINNFVVSQAEIPFGGVKDSGYGLEGGSEGLEAFQVIKAVSHKLR